MFKVLVLLFLLTTNLANMNLFLSKMPPEFMALYRSDRRVSYALAQDLYYFYAPKLQREINIVRRESGYPQVSLTWTRRFLFSWIKQESGFSNVARSVIGCIGLLQVCPQVWGLSKELLVDPGVNLDVGFIIFINYLRLAKGNIRNALLYYNNGYVWLNLHYADDIFALIKLY